MSRLRKVGYKYNKPSAPNSEMRNMNSAVLWYLWVFSSAPPPPVDTSICGYVWAVFKRVPFGNIFTIGEQLAFDVAYSTFVSQVSSMICHLSYQNCMVHFIVVVEKNKPGQWFSQQVKYLSTAEQ